MGPKIKPGDWVRQAEGPFGGPGILTAFLGAAASHLDQFQASYREGGQGVRRTLRCPESDRRGEGPATMG